MAVTDDDIAASLPDKRRWGDEPNANLHGLVPQWARIGLNNKVKELSEKHKKHASVGGIIMALIEKEYPELWREMQQIRYQDKK